MTGNGTDVEIAGGKVGIKLGVTMIPPAELEDNTGGDGGR
jgi:hypothetical protein